MVKEQNKVSALETLGPADLDLSVQNRECLMSVTRNLIDIEMKLQTNLIPMAGEITKSLLSKYKDTVSDSVIQIRLLTSDLNDLVLKVSAFMRKLEMIALDPGLVATLNKSDLISQYNFHAGQVLDYRSRLQAICISEMLEYRRHIRDARAKSGSLRHSKSLSEKKRAFDFMDKLPLSYFDQHGARETLSKKFELGEHGFRIGQKTAKKYIDEWRKKSRQP